MIQHLNYSLIPNMYPEHLNFSYIPKFVPKLEGVKGIKMIQDDHAGYSRLTNTEVTPTNQLLGTKKKNIPKSWITKNYDKTYKALSFVDN